ncbi:uncharacterized protein J3D65DRAFT_604088 [Phyllosticta citribraziliensis]|uniref:Uncharacterized protein n=1 Tax=Phyllosticta citribraziliensis TaxID=989973 RepID=A0ABR1LQT0_9PEZI
MCQRKTYLYSCTHQELQLRPCPSKCWIARRPDVEAQLLRAFASDGRRPTVQAGQVYVLRDAAAASPSPSLRSQELELESLSVSSSQQQRQLLGGSSAARRSGVVDDGGSDGSGAGAAATARVRARARERAAAPTADVVRRIGLCEDCEDVEVRVDAVLAREKREKRERRKRRAFRILGLDIDEVRKAREGVKSRVRRLGKGATGLFRDGGQ